MTLVPSNWPLLLSRGASGAAAAAGAVLGYDFGQQIGGLWLALLLALNAGVFFALVMGMLADRWVPSSRPQPAPENARAGQDPARVDQLARIFHQGDAHGAPWWDAWARDVRHQGPSALATSGVRLSARHGDAAGVERTCAEPNWFLDWKQRWPRKSSASSRPW